MRTSLARAHDRAWALLARRAPVLIRALIRFYDRWLELACPRDRVALVDGAELHVSPGVAWPIRTTHRALLEDVGAGVLVDVGCGSGYIGLMAARAGADVVSLDVNPAALADTRDNAHRLGLGDRVTVVESDGLSAFLGAADWIVSDPPWFAEEMGPRHRWTASLDFVERLLDDARGRLTPGGELRMVVPRFRGREFVDAGLALGWSGESVPMPRVDGPLRALRYLDFLPLAVVRLRVAAPARTHERSERVAARA